MTLERPRPVPRFDFIERYAGKYPELDPEAMRTYLTVRKLTARLDHALDAHLARHHLSFGRFMVLVNLLHAEGHSLAPAALSDVCGVTRATMTGLLDSLETSGHLVRDPDPDDHRSFSVRLTLSGRRFLERMLPDHFARLTRTMSALSHREMRQLRALLDAVFAAAHELEAPTPPPKRRRRP